MHTKRTVERLVLARDIPRGDSSELRRDAAALLRDGWYLALDYRRVFAYLLDHDDRVIIERAPDGDWMVTAGGHTTGDGDLDKALHRVWNLGRVSRRTF